MSKTKEVKFKLVGFEVVTMWGGGKGFANLLIKTDEKGLEKIKQNPLQDYLSFGVENVDYVNFEVYKIEVTKTEKTVTTKEFTEPVETIEAGTYDLTEKEEDYLAELLMEPPEVIRY